MTNAVRTWLLNESAAASPVPGEEYVPADYRPAALPPAIAAARRSLFGFGADRAGMNLTLARVLVFLHASRFARDVTARDARITYDPRKPADVWDAVGASVATIDGPPAAAWHGSPSFRSAGRAYGDWHVVTDGAGGYTATTAGGAVKSGAVVTGTTGDVVPLPGSDLSLVVPEDAAGVWRATLLVPPAHDWASAASASGDGVFNPQASVAEAGWFVAWSDPNEPAPLRAGALALALSERIRELPEAEG